jgi:bacillithiol system protein YtxJ
MGCTNDKNQVGEKLYLCYMKWTSLADIAQLDAIDRESATGKVMIFKHSTRCSTSSTAKARVERNWKEENEKVLHPYYLDLLAHRAISNAIAERYGVEHESPQVLIISKGKCIFSQSHLDISVDEMMEAA